MPTLTPVPQNPIAANSAASAATSAAAALVSESNAALSAASFNFSMPNGIATLDANTEVVEPQAGAAAEVAAGRTNSMKRADGTWSAKCKYLPDNYALQTWADNLAIGSYTVSIYQPQNGLPAGTWYLEVLRHGLDVVSNHLRYLRATPIFVPLDTMPIYHCSAIGGAWSVWTPMARLQATTAQAQAGTDTATDMSPARVKEAITASNKVLQVVGRTITTQGSQTLWANIDNQVGAGTDFILNVIPKASGSSFLIEYRWFGEVNGAWDVVFNVHRDGVRVNNIGLIKAGLSMATQTYGVAANNASTPEIMHLRTLDKSGSTAGASIQFKLVAAAMTNAAALWTNRCFNANAANGYEHGVSEIIITEIAA